MFLTGYFEGCAVATVSVLLDDVIAWGTTSSGSKAGLVECKGVDVKPTTPNPMAVAFGDPYLRVFDRRRVGPGAC
jgi:hypothetical protein